MIKYSDIYDTSKEALDEEVIDIIFITYFSFLMKTDNIKEALKHYYNNVNYVDGDDEGFPEKSRSNISNYYIKTLMNEHGISKLESWIEERKNGVLGLEKAIHTGETFKTRKLFPFILTCYGINKLKIMNAFSPQGNFLNDTIKTIHKRIKNTKNTYEINLYMLYDPNIFKKEYYVPNENVLVIFNDEKLKSKWYFKRYEIKDKKKKCLTFKFFKLSTIVKTEFKPAILRNKMY